MDKKIHELHAEFAEAFYERYKKRIYQLARYLSSDEDACGELMQETICILLDHLELLEQLQPEQVEAYIAKTMRSIIINTYRKSQKLSFVSLDDIDIRSTAVDLDDPSEKMMTHLEILDLMSKLPLEDRFLLCGRYIEGKTASELAAQLGCKADSIRMKMLRARKRAFRILQER